MVATDVKTVVAPDRNLAQNFIICLKKVRTIPIITEWQVTIEMFKTSYKFPFTTPLSFSKLDHVPPELCLTRLAVLEKQLDSSIKFHQ